MCAYYRNLPQLKIINTFSSNNNTVILESGQFRLI